MHNPERKASAGRAVATYIRGFKRTPTNPAILGCLRSRMGDTVRHRVAKSGMCVRVTSSPAW